MLVKRSSAICGKAEWQHGKSQPLHHHQVVILAISKHRFDALKKIQPQTKASLCIRNKLILLMLTSDYSRISINIDFAYYIFMKQTTHCPLDSTGRSWPQQQSNGDFLTAVYMADMRATIQKYFC
eukprot:445910-Ditylum_brightwellii.AAC.1